ncbi:VUT family protein [Legionella lytica]|uniref:VUT family protein n=1 Tax=Legionella lytica TaxID=96232 RepID=A0ABW8DAB8_9GAMM
MNQTLSTPKAPGFLCLTIGIVTFLTLLINVSFKIVVSKGLVFSIHAIICPIIAGLFLIALRKCTQKEQRHILNISLMSLYAFCLGVYVLINLPTVGHMRENPVYQIVFDDLPKKFFAVTISFVLSFYVPHLLCSTRTKILSSTKHCMLLALFGGLSFFILNFILLFAGEHLHNFSQIMLDSLMIATSLLLVIGIIYLVIYLKSLNIPLSLPHQSEPFPLCYYLSGIAVVIMLICLACEYRIVTLVNRHWILAASALFFPVTLAISTLIGELWGYQANLKLSVIIIASQVLFDILLSAIVILPSPCFCNSESFYQYIMMRRLPATFLTLSATFMSNALLLHYLKRHAVQRPLRILIANVCANSLLCLIDYSLLFGGIYSYEQIINLVVNVWQYKLFITILLLPLIWKCCNQIEKNVSKTVARIRTA